MQDQLVQNYNEGYDLIKSAKAYALIVFPDDFKKDLNRNKRSKIIYYYNNQTILIGGVITKDIQSAVSIMAKSSLIKVDEHIKSNPYLNYSYFLTYAAIAHIFQVFAALLAIWTIGVEFKDGTTKQWLKEANDSIINAVFGKLTVYLTVLMLEMIIIYFKLIFKDPGSRLIMVSAILLCSLFYTIPFSNHTTRNIPIGVIDNDNSAFSREFIRDLNSSEYVNVIESYQDMQKAKSDYYKNNIRAFVLIQQDFWILLALCFLYFISACLTIKKIQNKLD